MAFDAYLKLDGVDGETVRSGFEKWIEIYSFSWGASNPTSHSGAGMAAGKVDISGFNVMKKTDSASPQIFMKCCQGSHFKTATMTLNKAGGEKAIQYLKYEFTELFVDSVQWSGASGGDDTPTESVSFSFSSIKVTYTPQKADGSAGSPVVVGWDVKKNVKA